jgi:hypothetical protein
MEIIDKRAEKRAAETAAPKEPTVLEIVQDREARASAALSAGDLEAYKAVSAECKNPPAMYGDVVPFKKTVRGEVQTWKSVGYVVAFLPLGQNQVLMVRAAGLRSDGMLFTADYAMPPVWVEGTDFTAAARKRLETFKGCSCDERGRCKFHGEVCPGPAGPGRWLEEDIKRLQAIQGQQLPEAVEVLMRAEANKPNIIVPGR